MKRACAALGATFTVWIGCADLLDIPSGTGELEALHHTCECDNLKLQRGAFVASCDAAFADLIDAQATPQGKSQLLAVADLGCETCSNVEACYAAITLAGASGDACAGSDGCASWACCAGQLELVYEVGDGLKLQAADIPACCGECFGCGSAIDAFRDRQKLVVCEDSLPLANQIAGCLNAASKRPPAPCSAECGSGPSVDVASCVDCLIENGECANDYQACHADPDRPISVNGGS